MDKILRFLNVFTFLSLFIIYSCESTDVELLPEPVYDKTPCPSEPLVVFGGHEYPTILIGEQCWLKENLNIGTQIHGSELPIDNESIEKYCFENDSMNCERYGGLYTWDEMMQYASAGNLSGICPQGWHIPNNSDFEKLKDYTNGSTSCLQLFVNDMWAPISPSETSSTLTPEAFSESGFSAIPAGYKDTINNLFTQSLFGTYFSSAHFWLSSESSAKKASCFQIHGSDYKYHHETINKNYGYSVRCIKNSK